LLIPTTEDSSFETCESVLSLQVKLHVDRMDLKLVAERKVKGFTHLDTLSLLEISQYLENSLLLLMHQ
jgi:hypothetical protein